MRKRLVRSLPKSWLPGALGAFQALGVFAEIVAEEDRAADARADVAFELYGNALLLIHQQDMEQRAKDDEDQQATA